MEELSYTSKFDGETTDKILDNAKSIMEQTTAEDGETVQVYDTDGVPHKISKTELLKKSTLALPKLEDISAFVAVNAAGNAVGVMKKEQVASVLAELIGTATATKKGLVSSNSAGFANFFDKYLSESEAKNGFLIGTVNNSYCSLLINWSPWYNSDAASYIVNFQGNKSNCSIYRISGKSSPAWKFYLSGGNLYVKNMYDGNLSVMILHTSNKFTTAGTSANVPSGATEISIEQ